MKPVTSVASTFSATYRPASDTERPAPQREEFQRTRLEERADGAQWPYQLAETAPSYFPITFSEMKHIERTNYAYIDTPL